MQQVFRGWGLGTGVLVVGIWTSLGFSATESGRIYRDHSKPETLMFRFTRLTTAKPDGGEKRESSYIYPNGEVAVTEAIDLNGEGRLLSFERDQKQLSEKGRVEARDGRLHFAYSAYSEKGASTRDESLPDNLVVGGTIGSYLRSHWAELLAGKTLSVRLAAIDRKETVGFDFKKVREDKFASEDVVVIEMKATYFFVAALVNPLFFSLRKVDQKLVRVQGRVVPKEKKDNKWVDLDGDLVFD